jgi:hypothetical protein
MMGRSLGIAALCAVVATAAAAELRDELRPLQFLVGSCWTGTFPDGKATDTHCFEPVFEGQFLRDRHVVRGAKKAYAGESLYAWDPKQKKVTYMYWNSDGGISTGVAEPGSPGEITFPEEHTSSGGETTLKSVWTRRGDDAYDVWSAQKKDGQWREMWRMTLRRDPAGTSK